VLEVFGCGCDLFSFSARLREVVAKDPMSQGGGLFVQGPIKQDRDKISVNPCTAYYLIDGGAMTPSTATLMEGQMCDW
jgi:hypothetical protein